MTEKLLEAQAYHLMTQFEKRFSPKSFKKRVAENSEDVQVLRISLARESLNKIKVQLAK